HLAAHVFAAQLEEPELRPPLLGLVVSGGHSDLIRWQEDGGITVIGRTRDDAAGEAFDKGARILGLPFPGGPAIDKLATDGDPRAVAFRRPRALGRGVARNRRLREAATQPIGSRAHLVIPAPDLCTDNAAMIGAAALIEWDRRGPDPAPFDADPGLGFA